MERWADCSRPGRCWLWTDVETWARSPRPWTPRGFEQRRVVLCCSDTWWLCQAAAGHRLHSDLEVRSSGSPGGGYNSITRHTGMQACSMHAGWLAAVFSTRWQMCIRQICLFTGLNFAHTASAKIFTTLALSHQDCAGELYSTVQYIKKSHTDWLIFPCGSDAVVFWEVRHTDCMCHVWVVQVVLAHSNSAADRV